MPAAAPFRCDCGKIEGTLHAAPQKGLHLECFCDSCRAGALYCEGNLPKGKPLDLYLTQPENVKITKGAELLQPFAFSPRGIIRWKAGCCGVLMFSSQAAPRNAFMSLRTDRLTDPQAAGPVRSRSFIPKGNGKTRHEGVGGLIKLVFGSLTARLTGRWRKTPLFNPDTGKPIAPVTLVPREEKQRLLDTNA